MKKIRKVDRFNRVISSFILVVLIYTFTRIGLLKGTVKYTESKEIFIFFIKKFILFLLICEVNSVLHEGIHCLSGRLVIPNARFTINLGWNRAQTKRIGGDPTRVQDQIFTIMPFLVLSVITFFVGIVIRETTDIPMYFVIFNTAGSIKDIEWFLFMFCFPKDMKLSELNMDFVDENKAYGRFWKRWNNYFSK